MWLTPMNDDQPEPEALSGEELLEALKVSDADGFDSRVSRPPVVDPAVDVAVRGSKPERQLEDEAAIHDPGSTHRGG